MIKLDTTELKEVLDNLEAGQQDLAGYIQGLQQENDKRIAEINKLKEQITELHTQSLRDSKTLLDSIKSFFSSSKSTRLKETTIKL